MTSRTPPGSEAPSPRDETRPGAAPEVGPDAHRPLPADLLDTLEPDDPSLSELGPVPRPIGADTAPTDPPPRPSDRSAPGDISGSFDSGGSVFDTLPLVEQGRYRTRGLLGEGGIGRVERAYDRHLEREIAIKTLHTRPQDDWQRTIVESRFLDEARVTSQLEHPGVVPVYDIGRQPDGVPYYAMKQVRGHTLSTALEGTRLADRMRLLPRFVDVCQAVAYAHSRGVLHRDLKPDNVMLGDFGETLVVDWGLAKIRDVEVDTLDDAIAPSMDGRTRVGQVMGTPAYMSPEQARGKTRDLDARTDVWALGVMLFELVTGWVPFHGRNFNELMVNIQLGRRSTVHEVEKACPPELAAIIDKALQIDREERYPDAGAMARDLERYLSDDLVRAHRYTPLQRLRRFIQQHRVAIGMVLSLIMTAAAVGVWQDRQVKAAERAKRADLAGQVEALVGEARTTRPAGWIPQYAARLAALSSRVTALASTETDRRAALRPLVRLLSDAEPAMRRLAAHALGLTGRSHAVDPLMARLEPGVETDKAVVIDVIRALGVLGDGRAEKIVQTTRMRYGTASYVGVNTQAAVMMLPAVPPGPEGTSDDWANYGYSLVGKGRRDEGLAAYARALELKPDNPRALINRGLTLRRIGRLGEAIADYDRVLTLDGVHPLHRSTTLLNRALVHRTRGAFDAALADLDRLIAADTERHRGVGRRSRAQTRWLTGDFDGARRDLDAALAEQPDNRLNVLSDARLSMALGQVDRALDLANRAVTIEGDSAFAMRYRAWVHRTRGDMAAARIDLEQAMALEPTFAGTRAERLAVLVATGDLDTARADETRLFEEHPTDGHVWAAAAVRLYAGTGDWNTAAERLDRANDKANPAEAVVFGMLRRAVGVRLGKPGPLPPPGGEIIWHDRLLAVAAGQGDPEIAAAEARTPGQRCLLRLAVLIRDARTGQTTTLPPAEGYAAGISDLPDLACEMVDAMGLKR